MNSDPKPLPHQTDINVDTLLKLGMKAARAGNKANARALALALTGEWPDETRAWLLLAGVAANREERQRALEHALALDPDNPLARKGLLWLQEHPEPAQAQSTEDQEPTDSRESADPASAVASDAPTVAAATLTGDSSASARTLSDASAAEPVIASPTKPFTAYSWLIWLIGSAALIVILWLIVMPFVQNNASSEPTLPTPALPAMTPIVQPAILPEATSDAVPSNVAATPSVAASATPSSSPTATALALPLPTSLPMGTVVEYDQWKAVLLQPEYALALDGAIGDVQPDGAFVLTLLSISNAETVEQTLPPDLFVLVDDRGRSYKPAPGLSSLYLDVFGRAQRGDVALEEPLPAGGGVVSVPILFDVPTDARNITLLMGQPAAGGWFVLESVRGSRSVISSPTPNAGP